MASNASFIFGVGGLSTGRRLACSVLLPIQGRFASEPREMSMHFVFGAGKNWRPAPCIGCQEPV